MNVRDARTSGVALAALLAAAPAPAQEVHKCTANGSVTYQSKPCPTGDVTLPAAPTPSDQELRQARADQSRQRYQADTGQIIDRTIVPPPPPPAQATTTETTVYVLPGANGRAYLVRKTTRPAEPPKPLSNCDKLNADYAAAVDKYQQLKAPSELASHAELLRNANNEVARIRQLAEASHCNLR